MALDDLQKTTLLDMARKAIHAHLNGYRPAPVDPALRAGALAEQRGAFVTLHKAGQLRGCIGVFASKKALYEAIAEIAVASAVSDPRFRPLVPSELKDVEIEISVLSPLVQNKDIEGIKVGTHGIYVMKGLEKRGVLLPQVAVEHGYDRYEFLSQTCVKAGLRPDDWKDGGIDIYTFEAEIFSEKKTV